MAAEVLSGKVNQQLHPFIPLIQATQLSMKTSSKLGITIPAELAKIEID